LEEKRINYTRTDIDLANKPTWFEQKSPMGKAPLLIVNDKRALFESIVICEYVDEVTTDSLLPADCYENAYHRSLIEFGSSILNNIAGLYSAKDEECFQKIHTEIQGMFQFKKNAICGMPFFSGDKFHLIDATFGPIFRYFDVFDCFTDLNTFIDLPKCQLWRNALRQQKSIQKAVAENYSALLIQFLKNRESYISQLIPLEGIR
jgi:glutathione S-transferase